MPAADAEPLAVEPGNADGSSLPTEPHCPHVCEYRGMIARTWRGAVQAKDAPAYAAYVQKTGIEGYQRTPGNRGAWLLWRVEGDQAEFITVSFWESRAAIEAFAGQDIEKAVFYPDDEQFLIERDLTVHHYEVAATE
jgi:heme-degrading monooxygenase HmoA